MQLGINEASYNHLLTTRVLTPRCVNIMVIPPDGNHAIGSSFNLEQCDLITTPYANLLTIHSEDLIHDVT